MYQPPPPPVSRKPDGTLEVPYYGCGWFIRPVGKANKASYWHGGDLPGTTTLLMRRWDGLSWAVLFNQRSYSKEFPDADIGPALHRAAAAVKNGPATICSTISSTTVLERLGESMGCAGRPWRVPNVASPGILRIPAKVITWSGRS
jgi:hypothetical protein